MFEEELVGTLPLVDGDEPLVEVGEAPEGEVYAGIVKFEGAVGTPEEAPVEDSGKPVLGGTTIGPGLGKPLLPDIGTVVFMEDGGPTELAIVLAVIDPSLGGPTIELGLGRPLLQGTVVYLEGGSV